MTALPRLESVPTLAPVTSPAGRPPVHDIAAEEAVLSAAMLDGHALSLARPLLGDGQALYSPAHRRVWQALCALEDAGDPADVVTVAAWLKAHGRFAEVGLERLAYLADAVPYVANVETYAGIVRDLGRQRDLVARCQRVAAEGYSRQADVAEWVATAAASIADAALARTDESASHAGDVAAQLYASVGEAGPPPGLPTGIGDLDRVLGGLHAGDACVVAARPGMGKSALALTLAMAAASSGVGVAYFSAEMTRDQLTQRALSMLSGVPVDAWRKRSVRRERITEAVQWLRTAPLYLHDRLRTPTEVRAEAKRLAASSGLGLVVVDYLQKFRPDASSKAGSREQEVSEVMGRFADAATTLGVPFLVLSQLNREVEHRSPPVPELSDLRESGAIENDASQVLFLYRPSYYDSDAVDKSGPAEVLIAKNRHGACGKVEAYFDAPTCAWRGLERQ